MKKIFLRYLLPWGITAVMMYLTFKDINWNELWAHLREAKPQWLLLCAAFTAFSYVLRSARWPRLFADTILRFFDSYRVLILGFFMNNVLPARAGEFVRAHLGAAVTGKSRTIVLASIASERIADGVTISLLVAVSFWLFGNSDLDPVYVGRLTWVAATFGIIAVLVICMLICEPIIVIAIRKISALSDSKLVSYVAEHAEIFLNGLRPLLTPRNVLPIICWSLAIWLIELVVFVCVGRAANYNLSLASAVLFLASVNFSSLIPSAPGGFGVIEFIAKHVLVSLGVPSEEQALTMVLVQHVLQYVVVGIPGAFFLLTWKRANEARLQSDEVIESIEVL